MKRLCLIALLAVPFPAVAQVRPPVLTSVTPYGLQRGTTVTLTLEGANIASTDQVVFDVPGLSATIGEYKDLGADVRKRMPGETGAIIQDKAQKASLAISVSASADVPMRPIALSKSTPGTLERVKPAKPARAQTPLPDGPPYKAYVGNFIVGLTKADMEEFFAPAPLKEAADWLDEYRRFWEDSLDRLAEHLCDLRPKGEAP